LLRKSLKLIFSQVTSLNCTLRSGNLLDFCCIGFGIIFHNECPSAIRYIWFSTLKYILNTFCSQTPSVSLYLIIRVLELQNWLLDWMGRCAVCATRDSACSPPALFCTTCREFFCQKCFSEVSSSCLHPDSNCRKDLSDLLRTSSSVRCNKKLRLISKWHTLHIRTWCYMLDVHRRFLDVYLLWQPGWCKVRISILHVSDTHVKYCLVTSAVPCYSSTEGP